MNDLISAPATERLSATALREKSTEDLIRAIHSPGDEVCTLDRARTILSLYWEPDLSPQDRAQMLDEFWLALRQYPRWATTRAFDEWARTRTRRPSPGEIAILAAKELKRLTDEVEARKPRQTEPERREPKVTAEAAERIMREHGFNGMKTQRMPRPRNRPHSEEPEGVDIISSNPEALAAAQEAKRKADAEARS